MSATRTIHQRLREETAAAHGAIERVAVATGFLEDADAYGRYLRALHGFHAGLEDALTVAPDLPRWLPDIAERRKTPWLEADLAALDVAADAPRIALAYPEPASALGASYVVEGAMLGGRWILAHLGAAIPPGAQTFFKGYGARTGERWRSYCGAVAEHGDVDRVVAAAVTTFGQMEHWIAAHGSA